MRNPRTLILSALVSSFAVGCSCSSPPPAPDAGSDTGASLDGGADLGPPDAGYDGHRVYPTFCDGPTPGPEALRRMGDPAVHLLPGARALTPAGPQIEVGGFPIEVRPHPTLPIAYVANSGYGRRSIQVIDVSSGTLVQDLQRPEVFHGIAITPDGARLYVSTGVSGNVEEYTVAADGQLTSAGAVAVGDYPAGLTISSDGRTLWVARFHPGSGAMPGITEIDVATRTERRHLDLDYQPYQLVEIPSRHELWATGFAGNVVGVIDTVAWTAGMEITVGSNPNSIVASSDGSVVYVSVSDADTVVAIDTATRTIRHMQSVAEADHVMDAMGNPLHCSSPAGLWLDEASRRLYATRAADDAVQVLDATSLAPLGTIPVGWYPSAVTVVAGHLVTLDSKGNGVGPLVDYMMNAESGKERMAGTVTLVPLTGLDLAAQTTQFLANMQRPVDALSFTCDGAFPVPAHPGGVTPIEHVVLIVRENKTYDTVLGDIGSGDSDPSLVLYGEDYTPNLHALARQFTNHDNFYSDGETSVQGHFWLTSIFNNDYLERTWLEDYRGAPGWGTDPIQPKAIPDVGSFFTHLLAHDVDFRIYGEIVGSTGTVGTQTVRSHIDTSFPGGFFSLDVTDEEKARHVVDHIATHGLPAFTYILLPRDHTYGGSGGRPTPGSMISDNDYATGLVVEGLSHSPWWEHTAIFIVEDDTQIGSDHVDYHRSPLVIASPWARHGQVSSVHTSYTSLFRTFELILNLPPMHREDALATPLWDSFTGTPDLTPYTAVPRRIPDAVNPGFGFFAELAATMDFSGPDRAELLGAAVAAQETGVITPELRAYLARHGGLGARADVDRDVDVDEAAAEARDLDRDARIDEDDDRERAAYDRDVAAMRAYLLDHPEIQTDWAEMHR